MATIPVYVAESEQQADQSQKGTLGVLRSGGDEPPGVLKHVDADTLKNSISSLTSQLSDVFADLKKVGEFNLSEVSVSVAVSAEGGLILIGKAGITGGIRLKFKP